MKITNASGHSMVELSWHEALMAAGTNEEEPDMERDMKFLNWFGKKQYRIIDASDYETQQPKAAADGIELLIIKGNDYVRKS